MQYRLNVRDDDHRYVSRQEKYHHPNSRSDPTDIETMGSKLPQYEEEYQRDDAFLGTIVCFRCGSTSNGNLAVLMLCCGGCSWYSSPVVVSRTSATQAYFGIVVDFVAAILAVHNGVGLASV